MNEIPVSTKWTLDAAGEAGRIAIDSVFLIHASKTNEKGTGFLLTNGVIITNNHVVKDNPSNEIFAYSSSNQKIEFSNSILDPIRDLAALIPKEKLKGGLVLGSDQSIQVGMMVSTWGFPLMYNGPAPLLSIGYLSGYQEYSNNAEKVKHLVVNGAFNPGNSGGPLFVANNNQVIGVVVSKHVPITTFLKSALKQLQNNRSGVVFQATDENGNQIPFVESQLIGQWLQHLRKLTQVMIGEAISVTDLKNFLKESSLEIPK